MSVRRRMVRDRVERDAKWDKGWSEFDASLARIKRVVDEAIAEGLTTLTPEQFSTRLKAIEAQPAAPAQGDRDGFVSDGSGES